mmetsp:Transcript_5862/g.12222  ORF Transcript_5862/g.12222 Transcript_5862/m.12222 type:complete len:93 (-) Transcript_5862:141-419(-)
MKLAPVETARKILALRITSRTISTSILIVKRRGSTFNVQVLGCAMSAGVILEPCGIRIWGLVLRFRAPKCLKKSEKGNNVVNGVVADQQIQY